MHNYFLVTSCLEELWIIKIPCVMIVEQNISLYYRMFGLPTGGKSESLYFYSMRRGRLVFMSQVFSNERQKFRVFDWYWLMASYKNKFLSNSYKEDNLESTKNRNIQSFGDTTYPYKEGGGGKNGIIVKNIYTINISVMEKCKNCEDRCTFDPNLNGWGVSIACKKTRK